MAFELSELNDEKVEQLRLSEWFDKLIKEQLKSKKQRK